MVIRFAMRRLKREDFNLSCCDLAKYLLGKILARSVNGQILRGRIVETEAYPGADDECSHSYNYKQTPRNKAMFMDPGTIYVYMTYGMYYCMNVSSKGDGSAVLLRAIEPLEGRETMESQRIKNRKTKKSSSFKMKELCNGPSKLCQAFFITKELDQKDLSSSSDMWIEIEKSVSPNEIVVSTRIGLNPKSAGYNALLRYYIRDNEFVSAIKKEDGKR